MIRFGKPDCLISSALVAVRGTVGSGEGVLFLIKWRLTRKENKIHDTQGIVVIARRSNKVKMRRKPKTRAKSVKKSKK
jgi:hypothetical protein